MFFVMNIDEWDFRNEMEGFELCKGGFVGL